MANILSPEYQQQTASEILQRLDKLIEQREKTRLQPRYLQQKQLLELLGISTTYLYQKLIPHGVQPIKLDPDDRTTWYDLRQVEKVLDEHKI